MTVAAVMQPPLFGWLGFWDMADQADTLVLLDCVAIDRKSWQTRNRIRARDGQQVWLSIPVHAHQGDLLSDVTVADNGWQDKHMRTLHAAYGHAPYWRDVENIMRGARPWSTRHLATYTAALIYRIANYLGVYTTIVRASTLGLFSTGPIDRVADICRAVNAGVLLNTPGARGFLAGHDIGVPIRWHDYTHPTYTQGEAEFVSHLSVLDLLAWHGPDSLTTIRAGRTQPSSP